MPNLLTKVVALSFVLLWAGSAGAGKLTVAQQCEKARIKADIELASCMGKAKLKGIKGQPGEEEARSFRCLPQLFERLRKAEERAERKGESCPRPEPVTETTETPSWLMVQDSGSVSFDFDVSIDEGCPAEAFWSGTMTMEDADPETLWFSDRPDRVAFTQTTDEFVTGFHETFTASTGGDPNAVLNWQDPADDVEKHAVLELRYVEGTSPQYDGDARVLTYSVCGLRLDDPDTLQPLPESEQVEPPESVSSIGNITLFIDSVVIPAVIPALGGEPTQIGPFLGVSVYDLDGPNPGGQHRIGWAIASNIPSPFSAAEMVGWWMVVNGHYLKIHSVAGADDGWNHWQVTPSICSNIIPDSAPCGSSYEFTVSFCTTNPCPGVEVPWSSQLYIPSVTPPKYCGNPPFRC